MSSLRAHALSFGHSDARLLFSDVTFHLVPGWTGLVGPNGAGKTTLLGLISGSLAPVSGRLELEPRDGRIVTCPQIVDALDDDLRAFSWDWSAEAMRLRARLGLDVDALERWDTLSPGERKRWQVGAALAAEPDVLLLDEPTNHLDVNARDWLVEALRGFAGIGLVVSHDRALLDALTTSTLRVHGGSARLFKGSYSVAQPEWIRERERQWSELEAQQERERKLKAQLVEAREKQASADRGRSTRVRARGKVDSDARGMMAKTLAAWAEKKAGREVSVVRDELERAQSEERFVPVDKTLGRSVFVDFERAPMSTIFSLAEPTLEAGERVLLRDVSVSVDRSARIWISGENGAGKSTLVRELLSKAHVPRERLLVLPQDLSGNEGDRVLAEVKALSPDVKGRVLSLVAALGVDPAAVLATTHPSPGEARKLLLALGLGKHAWGLVLDEPTNHLDLPSIESLEAALVAYPGAIVLVTHDEAFARRIASTRWHLAEERVTISSVD